MKNIFTTIITILCISSLGFSQTAETSADPNAPSFQWRAEAFDFGSIPQDIPATATFIFTNSGTTPLIITNVQKTCGCTETKWPEQPIMPGEKGTITAVFNAASEGAFTKSITVESNASTPVVKLNFKGTVVKDPTGGAPENKTIFNSPN